MSDRTEVHLCCSTNSTPFTDCCGVAVNDWQYKCPNCGKIVVPEDPAQRFRLAYGKGYSYE